MDLPGSGENDCERDGEGGLLKDAASSVENLLGRKLTPEELEDLKRGLSEDIVLETLLYSERSYFVLGSYGTDEKDQQELVRLELVRDVLDERHPSHHAFLLSELPDFYPNWVVQFAVAAHRVDHVVCVFEHSFGGHEFEAGVLTLLRSHDLWVLKRAYDSESKEREHFDGMMAHFFELVKERDELRTWRDERELETLASEELPGKDTS